MSREHGELSGAPEPLSGETLRRYKGVIMFMEHTFYLNTGPGLSYSAQQERFEAILQDEQQLQQLGDAVRGLLEKLPQRERAVISARYALDTEEVGWRQNSQLREYLKATGYKGEVLRIEGRARDMIKRRISYDGEDIFGFTLPRLNETDFPK